MSVVEGARNKGKLEVIVKALDLADYTIKITANEKIFDPKFRAAITDDLVAHAKDIYLICWTANNIRVTTDIETYKKRKELQDEAIVKCTVFLGMLDIAKKVFHLETRRVTYWGNKIINCRKLIRAWRNADKKRYDTS
ncbi:hypothetical protein IKF15_00825 [Candidatus Saccharibacteria bacterium]|nr:hypothetical protein [Candidatus Saccharibacteria bacterium]